MSRILNKSKASGTEYSFIFNQTYTVTSAWIRNVCANTDSSRKQTTSYISNMIFLSARAPKKILLKAPLRDATKILKHTKIYFLVLFFLSFSFSFFKNNSLCCWSMKGLVFFLILSDLGNIPHCCTNPFLTWATRKKRIWPASLLLSFIL